MFKKDLSDVDFGTIAYMQLKDIENRKISIKERIKMLESSLHFNCNEAFGLLGKELRDNYKKLSYYDKMWILEALEKSEKVGCIEPLLDLPEMFESVTPKSRYSYQEMSKVIDIIGRSRKKWLIPVLTKYSESSSRLIRESARNAISKITNSN